MTAQRALLSLAVGAGLVAGVLYWFATQRVAVLVASAEIRPGTPIAGADLATVDLPMDAIPNGAVTDASFAVGRSVRGPLSPGQLLLAADLTAGPVEFSSGLRIPAGERAIAVPVEASQALGGAVAAGARVDLIAVPADGRDDGRATELVVRSALVLDVRGEQGGPFAPPAGRASSGMVRDRLGSVVLAVSAEAELWIADRIPTSTFVLALVPDP